VKLKARLRKKRSDEPEMKSQLGRPHDFDVLRAASRFIQSWVLSQPAVAVKEESLTDWLLFDIYSKSRRTVCRQFTRHSEARETGADWEWWILFDKQSFRLRVQAKKLSQVGDNYASIAYTNKHGLQIDTLLDGSAKANALPFYAFYSGGAPGTRCRESRHDEGVFLAGGRKIYADFIEVGKKFVSASEVLLRTTPLSCLLGCPLVHAGLSDFLHRYYPDDLRLPAGPNASPHAGPRGVYEQLPAFVSALIRPPRKNNPGWFEEEFADDVHDIKALVVSDRTGTKPQHEQHEPQH
jgi:hypothetical protein